MQNTPFFVNWFVFSTLHIQKLATQISHPKSWLKGECIQGDQETPYILVSK